VIDSLRSVKLSKERQLAFAAEAMMMRFQVNAPVTAEQVLAARRPEDEGNVLWNVFNRVQENLLKGGIVGQSSRGTGRQQTITAIGSADKQTILNRRLWALAEDYANV
jgi:hypothetical protein